MSRPCRVLVVDDDPALLRLLTVYLGVEGFEVDAAPDAETALSAAAATPPDLAIMDVMLHGVDGIEACRRIKADPRTRHVPVLLFTALSREAENESGADAVVLKPAGLRALRAAADELLAAGRMQLMGA